MPLQRATGARPGPTPARRRRSRRPGTAAPRTSIASIRSSIAARAGSISGEWNAPATRSRIARTFRSFASASARSIAETEPEITDLRRRVLVRDDEHVVVASLVAERRGVLGADAEQRRHRARAFLAGPLHRGAAHDHEVERVGERHDAGRHERGELAERMAGHPDERRAFGLQHAERRDVAREQRRLHELGRRERGRRRGIRRRRLGPSTLDASSRIALARGMRRPRDRPSPRTAIPAPGRAAAMSLFLSVSSFHLIASGMSSGCQRERTLFNQGRTAWPRGFKDLLPPRPDHRGRRGYWGSLVATWLSTSGRRTRWSTCVGAESS